MEKRIAWFAVIFMVLTFSSTIVLALPPLGPPRARLGQDEWAIGIEYGRSDMDLETWSDVTDIIAGTPQYDYTKFKINGLESNMVFGKLAYGVDDNWDAFIRLGVVDGKDEIVEDPSAGGGTAERYDGLDGGFGFAWGVGGAVTFWQEGDITWGALLQMTWLDPDSGDVDLRSDSSFVGEADFDYWEVQIAAGPTVELENFRLYGGPFLHFVGGDIDIDGLTETLNPGDTVVLRSQDIREKTLLGGFIGAEWPIVSDGLFNIELQATSDAWAVGLGAIWRFE